MTRSKKYQTKDISDTDVCIATHMYQQKSSMVSDGKFIYDYLHELIGAPIKVCYNAMQRAYDRGYIECGVSLRTSWLTDKGKELINSITIETGIFQ